MKQVAQPVGGGQVRVLDVPAPVIDPAQVLVRTVASVTFPCAGRAVTALAGSGVPARTRSGAELPLGCSAAGLVAEVGDEVEGIAVGQLVATGGASHAGHAEFQAVPALLCTEVPGGVPAEDAAFATLASLPLHALRLSGAGLGSKIVVIGLGLAGQLAARLARASGCDVAGIDQDAFARQIAAQAGVLVLDEAGDATTDQILAWSRGRGADAVLVCAADRSPRPMSRVSALCRDRAAVVMVGDVGVPSSRVPFHERELSLLFARFASPGRSDPSYEEWGIDHPVSRVYWTEGRNRQAVLQLLASGRLRVSDLVTHSFGIGEADVAFRLLAERTEPCLAIRLSYPAASDPPIPDRPAALRPDPSR